LIVTKPKKYFQKMLTHLIGNPLNGSRISERGKRVFRNKMLNSGESYSCAIFDSNLWLILKLHFEPSNLDQSENTTNLNHWTELWALYQWKLFLVPSFWNY
jgi:hypothetical protein